MIGEFRPVQPMCQIYTCVPGICFNTVEEQTSTVSKKISEGTLRSKFGTLPSLAVNTVPKKVFNMFALSESFVTNDPLVDRIMARLLMYKTNVY